MEDYKKYIPPKHIKRVATSDFLVIIISFLAVALLLGLLFWPLAGFTNAFLSSLQIFGVLGVTTCAVMLANVYPDHAFGLALAFWFCSLILDGKIVSVLYKSLSEIQTFEISAVIVGLIEVIIYITFLSPTAEERDIGARKDYPFKTYARLHPDFNPKEDDYPEWVFDISFRIEDEK